MRNAIEAHGYQPDTTPVDTLMAGPVAMHLAVAEEMEECDCIYCDPYMEQEVGA